MANYSDPTVITMNRAGQVQPGAYLILAAGIVALLVAAAFAVQAYLATSKTKDVELAIQTKETELRGLQSVADELKYYDGVAKNLHLLFDNQKEWDVILSQIESRLYKRMAVSAIQLSDAGEFNFSGTTSDFVEYGRIFTSLTDSEANNYFTTVRPTSLMKVDKDILADGGKTPTGDTEVQFSFSMKLNSTVLAKKSPVEKQ